jgi:hypothetical protein
MQQIPQYGDSRQLSYCAFCGGIPETRDHCPSRVLLDEPYPENLPVVPACLKCNSRFSQDEEYFACLMACIKAGSTEPTHIRREKIRRILSEKSALQTRLEQARRVSGQQTIFIPEEQRVRAVIIKLAQGHSLFELHEPCIQIPDEVDIRPFELMSASEQNEFETPAPSSGWPEVGSRAMQRMVIFDSQTDASWIEVQAGLYRFNASIENGITIRMVIDEYLACLVRWNP